MEERKLGRKQKFVLFFSCICILQYEKMLDIFCIMRFPDQ